MEDSVTLEQIKVLEKRELVFKALWIVLCIFASLLVFSNHKKSSKLEATQKELLETKESLENVNEDFKNKQTTLSALLERAEHSIKKSDTLLALEISKAIEKHSYIVIHVKKGEKNSKFVSNLSNDLGINMSMTVRVREVNKTDFGNKVVYFEASNKNRAEKLKNYLEREVMFSKNNIEFDLINPNILAPEGLIELWVNFSDGKASSTKLISPYKPDSVK